MRRFTLTLGLIAASFALVASTAEAAKTSEKEEVAARAAPAGLDRSERAPCQKRVEGELWLVPPYNNLQNVSCRKARKVMRRFLKGKDLGPWECNGAPGGGLTKCGDTRTFDGPSRKIATFYFVPCD
jgi:hypothetical protein